ncbi:hypothetical protein BCV70DRAFT_38832 [Testicularia cyperi]|uniref:Uncharacterized protein n=1 Tax=Testicularia cyperi TaxID=1882483 RepID=A0A317XIB5_9BASI|nr:hypothetical protein BCV70DRAFT_38832 [Testicularia cyperi]
MQHTSQSVRLVYPLLPSFLSFFFPPLAVKDLPLALAADAALGCVGPDGRGPAVRWLSDEDGAGLTGRGGRADGPGCHHHRHGQAERLDRHHCFLLNLPVLRDKGIDLCTVKSLRNSKWFQPLYTFLVFSLVPTWKVREKAAPHCPILQPATGSRLQMKSRHSSPAQETHLFGHHVTLIASCKAGTA